MIKDDEDQLLRSVALQNAQTILRARQRAEQELVKTKEALEEERRILELLNHTGARLASKLDLPGVIQTVSDAATQICGAQFGAFFYAATGADPGTLPLYTLSGAPREAFEPFEERILPLLGPTFRGEGIVRLADVHADPRYESAAPSAAALAAHPAGAGSSGAAWPAAPAGHLPVCSCLAVPVMARSGAVIGAIVFGHEGRAVFTERAERLAVGIAAQAAIAIDNARLYAEATRSAEERSRLLEAERAARIEIERISLVKDEFLATLSHELRTPLNAVLGWSGVLMARTHGDPEMQRGLETIARNARAQAQLIEDLLDMNRIVSGKIRLDVQRLELATVVEAALDSVMPSAEAKGIAIRRTIDPGAGLVSGDPNRLQQVVWNLLSNAVKFTPKGGKIDVIVQRVNSHVEIQVRDTGMGIEPEFLPYLFERFRQADSSTTRKYGGLGLGLSIVKQLVELHGGSVEAESAGQGQGAVFIVALPLRAVREAPRSSREHPTAGFAPISHAPEISLAGLSVLVVDDEPDARELVRSVLIHAGAVVFAGGTAAEGLSLVKAHRPDVLVSDIGMPDCDGYQFIRDVRGLGAAGGGKTPAIALTAFARSEDRTRAMLAGYQVHVAKPIEARELVATIRSLAANRVER
jgi:signal transduction histidine kinase/ActR/RegA family two-component response regulator